LDISHPQKHSLFRGEEESAKNRDVPNFVPSDVHPEPYTTNLQTPTMHLSLFLQIFTARYKEIGGEDKERGGGVHLSNLVLVVGKREVDAACVDVDTVAEESLAHRRTLDVPTGPPLP
jgi:hypothetical protein